MTSQVIMHETCIFMQVSLASCGKICILSIDADFILQGIVPLLLHFPFSFFFFPSLSICVGVCCVAHVHIHINLHSNVSFL